MGGKPSMNNFYWDGTGLCFHAEQAAIFTKLPIPIFYEDTHNRPYQGGTAKPGGKLYGTLQRNGIRYLLEVIIF
jgi:hypothetical protein